MKTLILIFVLFITTCLFSTIINVPGDQPTIQEGIDAAAETDTVLVAEGTYFENIDFIGKAITVASNFLIDADTLHIENTIINGSQATNPDFGSCARFISGEDTTSVLIGFYLTQGTGTFDPGFGMLGGGILCKSSSPKIVSNIVKNNSSDDYVGGIVCYINCSPILLNNVISYNTAVVDVGGVSLWDNCSANLEGNIISNNTANNHCGGLLISDSSPTLVDNIIRENTAPYGDDGGVIIQFNSSPILLNNIISYNTAAINGGGMEVYYLSGTSHIYMENCTIYGNEAGGCGSQINCQTGGLEVVNSIIGGSTTNGSVYFNTSTPTFDYCDFYNSDGPDFDGPSVPPTLGVITTVNNNGDPCDEFMNIFLDPMFVDPANGDYHLTEFSPCIDAGDPLSPPDPDGTIADIGRFCYLTPPSNLYVDENTGLLTWDAPMADDLTGYDVYLDGVFQDNTTDTEWQFTGLLNGQDYIAGVAAVYDEVSSDLVTIDFTYTGTGAGNNLVSVTELIGNYPNPFNPETTISYQLPENCKVELTVYNLKGQKVKTLVNETLESGNHTVIWKGKDDNGKSVSSGIYFYKMKIENHVETKKMILMK